MTVVQAGSLGRAGCFTLRAVALGPDGQSDRTPLTPAGDVSSGMLAPAGADGGWRELSHVAVKIPLTPHPEFPPTS